MHVPSTDHLPLVHLHASDSPTVTSESQHGEEGVAPTVKDSDPPVRRAADQHVRGGGAEGERGHRLAVTFQGAARST